MNPIGIMIGWIVSSSGPLIVGIFTSISAGTFLYIATIEVLVEEFNLQRYKKSKFVFYLLAVGMICSIWFVEQAAGAE
jgi:solute carrier family 39 (zinc transporter), member 1/2/3